MTWEELETLHFFPSSATVSVLTADSIIINSIFTTALNVKPMINKQELDNNFFLKKLKLESVKICRNFEC